MKTTTFAAAMVAAGVLLAGCAGADNGSTTPPPTTPTSAAADHNAADIAFAQGMIPHHEQAVEMAALVEGRTTTPEVLSLAERVEQAQAPEIRTMTQWLAAWGAPTAAGGHEGHGPGMMSAEDMTRLEDAKNADFDRRWLEMMIEHHEGAVEMARIELAEGGNAEAKALAQQIIDAQQAEITEMHALLDS
ncbi:DUF305 domain-containing protein [Actinokineospora sp. UTMC 2448]|uniref:DUF305 domain-containing protein n=1 Tax=Actinokineospora sp. UTMC 2448 TaxID=2268449 RepID=UPI002164E0BD|nr:DUF305 domain-containing protein [Actinokineospora sp. UTMC 2448]UVS80368.1 putative outer membrane protein [Actinokineospora sp. UTMC 2448]